MKKLKKIIALGVVFCLGIFLGGFVIHSRMENKIAMPFVYHLKENQFLESLYPTTEEIKETTYEKLQVPKLTQEQLPNGCEAVSTVIVLQYLGYDITPTDFVDQYLPMEKVYTKKGVRIGPNPDSAYAGDPKSKSAGWGAYPSVLIQATKRYMKEEQRNLEMIDYSRVPLANIPILVPVVLWTTIDYEPCTSFYVWQNEEQTETYFYPKNSHTVVLLGSDTEYYFVYDPLAQEEKQIPRATLEEVYDSVGRHAFSFRSI